MPCFAEGHFDSFFHILLLTEPGNQTDDRIKLILTD